MYSAEVLADSISGYTGTRLFTIQATFPRFILAEVNTHRAFSRNSASSRAIPPERHISRIKEFPFVPEAFHKRVKGMGQGEVLDKESQKEAREAWLKGRTAAVETAEALLEKDISKSHVNRVLEPYMWHTAIISSTEWDNFFSLRVPLGDEVDYDFEAQPEFQRIGIMIREAMRQSAPTILLKPEEWHIPLVDDDADDYLTIEEKRQVSAGRCAKVSYEKMEFEPAEDSIRRTQNLIDHGHMSPTEHVARILTREEHRIQEVQRNAILDLVDRGLIDEAQAAQRIGATEFVGNFRNFLQMRKTIPHEQDRVGFIKNRLPWWATDGSPI